MNKNFNKIENVEMVWMPVDYIKNNVKKINENRCASTDEEECKENLYTNFDLQKSIRRIKSYKSKIFQHYKEWFEATPMKIYDVEGTYYMTDGQGRFKSLLEYNETETPKIEEIPVMIVKGKTYDQMIDQMIAMNQSNVNWSTSAIFRANMLRKGDTSFYESMCEVQNLLNVSEYTAKLILFGYANASHRDKIIDEYSPYKDVMFKCFKDFYDGVIPSCSTKREINTIKKIDCAQALYRIYALIIRTCENEGVAYEDKLEKCNKVLIDYVAKMDRSYVFAQVFGGKQMLIASNFKTALKKARTVKGDDYIQEALLNAA